MPRARSRAPIRRPSATRRSPRNAGSTRCSTASPTRHSPACSSSRRSTCVTCSRSATCSTGTRGRPRTRTVARLGRRLHDHPAELAAVLPEALALADLPDPDALAEALRELADRRYRADGLTLLASKTGPMSEQLQAVLRRAVSQAVWASASRQLGFTPARTAAPTTSTSDCNHSTSRSCSGPRTTTGEIADLFDFDDFTHWLGRRFCSVLLARMLTPLDWDAAVRYLDFPERFINDGYNTTFAKLRANGRFDELAARVKRIANQHAERRPDRLQAAPRLLRDWEGIDLDCWHLLQPRPRPLSPFWRTDAPVRRRRASLWLWCHLTSGHERAAPIPTADRARALRPNAVHPRRPADPARAAADPRRAAPRNTRRRPLDAPQPPRRSTAPARIPDRRTTTSTTIDPLITTAFSRTSAPTPASTSHPHHPLDRIPRAARGHTRPAARHQAAAPHRARLLQRDRRRDRRRRQPPRRQRPALPTHARARSATGSRSRPASSGDRTLANARAAPPSTPAQPAHARHRHRHPSANAAELLNPSHGEYVGALHQHRPLPRPHRSHLLRDRRHPQRQRRPARVLAATVARHRRADPDFEHRYRQLLRPSAASCNDKPATPTRTSSAA